MSAIPGDVDTSQQPPMTVPLQHFLLACGFLLAAGVVGVGSATGGTGSLAHFHLLLVGFVCVTIMGAMTQFVPVWSGVALHSRRLATAQLWLVAAGLVGFAATLLAGSLSALPWFGLLMLVGFWTFAYNLGRTLAAVDGLDVTERHFALALGFFVLLTVLGVSLAAEYAGLVVLPVAHGALVGAHATLAVFGAVLTTVFGALYQLATMFTQTDLDALDERLQRVETVGHPLGVVLLAGGRLFESVPLARVGGLLVLVCAVAVAVVLARKLVETSVEWTPMLSRYVVVTVSLAGWAVLATPAWLDDPTTSPRLFGAEGAAYLLLLGVVGFVVLGTLYHVVPFIVWVHRYSDRIGFEDVPMVDDLYDDRLAATDFALFLAGTGLLVAAGVLAPSSPATTVGVALVTAGAAVFAVNVVLVLREHSPYSLVEILLDRAGEDGGDGVETPPAPDD